MPTIQIVSFNDILSFMDIKINDKTYSIQRLKLRAWIDQDKLRKKFFEFASANDRNSMCNILLQIGSMNTGIPIEELKETFWVEVVNLFQACILENKISIDFPMYRVTSGQSTSEVWEYPERTWYMWAHALASAFGWTLEYIAELDIHDATALLQEIYVKEQLDREFIWMTSEIAYPYNSSSKKSEFHPLPRPVWMREELRQIEQLKSAAKKVIPKDMMPIGTVVKGGKLPNALHP